MKLLAREVVVPGLIHAKEQVAEHGHVRLAGLVSGEPQHRDIQLGQRATCVNKLGRSMPKMGRLGRPSVTSWRCRIVASDASGLSGPSLMNSPSNSLHVRS